MRRSASCCAANARYVLNSSSLADTTYQAVLQLCALRQALHAPVLAAAGRTQTWDRGLVVAWRRPRRRVLRRYRRLRARSRGFAPAWLILPRRWNASADDGGALSRLPCKWTHRCHGTGPKATIAQASPKPTRSSDQVVVLAIATRLVTKTTMRCSRHLQATSTTATLMAWSLSE